MNEQEILDYLNQPVGFFFPHGYMGCWNCRQYFHHPIIYCHGCGKEISKHENVPFLDFIKRFRSCGSGPMNSLWWFLFTKRDKQPTNSREKLSAESRQIYDYARKA